MMKKRVLQEAPKLKRWTEKYLFNGACSMNGFEAKVFSLKNASNGMLLLLNGMSIMAENTFIFAD